MQLVLAMIGIFSQLVDNKDFQGLTLSLLRVINFKFPLQPHQKYYITHYVELGFR